MKRTSCRWLAAARLGGPLAPPLLAALFFALAGTAATRPRYGGALRVQMRASVESLDPAEPPARPEEAAAREQLCALVFEPLVRIGEDGRPQPALAISWQPDAAKRQWQFRLRPGVKFHDGSPAAPAAVAQALQQSAPADRAWRVSAFGETVVIRLPDSRPDLLFELARARSAVFRRTPDGVLLGTGPFRLAEWEAGRRAVFAAHDDFWGGRPFLDAIEVEMGRAPREQLIDLELGKADVVELLPDQVRRAAQGGRKAWSSGPVELMALSFNPERPAVEDPRLRQAIALSIDRGAMHNVLLRRQGEIAGAIFPQWLTGYAFLFSTAPDLERARKLVAEVSPRPGPIVLGYDAGDALARAVAERIAVNTREVGIPLQVSAVTESRPGAHPDAWLNRARLEPRPETVLASLAGSFGLGDPLPPGESAGPERLYAVERDLLERFYVVPLFHLPAAYGLSARVRNWSVARWGGWQVAEVWLETPAPGGGEEKP